MRSGNKTCVSLALCSAQHQEWRVAPVARPNDRALAPERSCGNTMSGTPRRGSNIVTHLQGSRSQHKTFVVFVVGSAIELRRRCQPSIFHPCVSDAPPTYRSKAFCFVTAWGEKNPHVRAIILTSWLTDLHVCFCSSRHRKKRLYKRLCLVLFKKP